MIHRLQCMLKELQQYKGHTKSDLMYDAVKDRLEKSFDSYQHDTDLSLEYLKHREPLNITRRLNSKRK